MLGLVVCRRAVNYWLLNSCLNTGIKQYGKIHVYDCSQIVLRMMHVFP